jgi:hypothetical protein
VLVGKLFLKEGRVFFQVLELFLVSGIRAVFVSGGDIPVSRELFL